MPSVGGGSRKWGRGRGGAWPREEGALRGAGPWEGAGAGGVMARAVAPAAAAATSVVETEVAAATATAARVADSPRTLARRVPVVMEDFIVISDDSGSESSGASRSGRARRLRRALSRTPGALPRRTVVSEEPPLAEPRRGQNVASARAWPSRDPRPGPPPRPPPPLFGCSQLRPLPALQLQGARRAGPGRAGQPGLRLRALSRALRRAMPDPEAFAGPERAGVWAWPRP